jgi:hypothetical protein
MTVTEDMKFMSSRGSQSRDSHKVQCLAGEGQSEEWDSDANAKDLWDSTICKLTNQIKPLSKVEVALSRGETTSSTTINNGKEIEK